MNYSSVCTLNVIIPIRNRNEQLNLILQHLPTLLPEDYNIFIIEQSQHKPFNKGKLINIGVLETLKHNTSSRYFVAQDVDTFPLSSGIIDYKCYKHIKHPYGHPFALGGIVFFDKDSFFKINGFSNKYWGWGSEDKDLQFRANAMKIPIDRSNFIQRRSNKQIFDPQSKSSNKQIQDLANKRYDHHTGLYTNDVTDIQNDGIRNTDYKVLHHKNLKENIHHILVDI